MTPELVTAAAVLWLVVRFEMMSRRLSRLGAVSDVLVQGHSGDPLSHKLLPAKLRSASNHAV